MFDEKLRKLAGFVQANRPQWKYIVEGDTIRICTLQFVINWDIFRQIEDQKDFIVFEVIEHSTLGAVVCLRPVAND